MPSRSVQELIDQKVVPSFEGNTALKRSLLSEMQDILIQTDQGLIPSGRIKIDAERMDRVAQKVVQGLHFHLFRRPLPEGTEWSYHWMPRNALIPEAMEGGLVNVDRDVFTCRYRVFHGPPYGSIWWLLFYKTVLYVVTAVEPKPAR
jgi:hypothetical protein